MVRTNDQSSKLSTWEVAKDYTLHNHKGFHMRLLTPTRILTLQIQRRMQKGEGGEEDSCEVKHTGKADKEKAGDGTVAITSDETKEFNCVMNGGHTTTFSVRPMFRQ